MSSRLLFHRCLLVAAVILGTTACTASNDIRTAQKRLRNVEDFRGVDMSAVSKPLNEYRKLEEDEVLYHLEHAMLAHYKEQWDQSSRHFQQAQFAINKNFTKSINRNVQSMLVNDLQLAYHGEAYEDVYLNAIKALNYLHKKDLEDAMVEARNVIDELEQLSDRYKGLAESLSRDTAQTAVKRVDDRLNNVDLLDKGDQEPVEVRQNSALGRFLTTVLYAKTGSPDDARIELNKLRTALEDQGNSGFLTALLKGQDTTSTRDSDQRTLAQDPTTALSLLLSTRGASPPLLSVRVNGSAPHMLLPDSLEERDDAYGVRIEGLRASRGDTISITSNERSVEGAWLEVWSDSLQYRGPIGESGSSATFVLGTSVTTIADGGESSQTRAATPSEGTSLEEAKLSYALTRVAPEGREHSKLIRTLESIRGPRGPAWRVIERAEPAMSTRQDGGLRTDTMRLSAPSLDLERHRQGRSDGDGLAVRRNQSHVTEPSNAWGDTAVEFASADRIYGEGVGMEMALADRSLTVGEHVPLSVYVSSEQAVRTIEAQVLGTDSVSTPAGRYATYEVRLVPPSPHYGTARLYLRESRPHHVVQATLRLPVLTSGRRDTLTLKRTLTELTTLKDGTPPSRMVAARQTERPPADLPVVKVDHRSSTRDEDAARVGNAPAAKVPALSNGSTYNTMLVSFSGQAPVKRERKFSFNFTISGEQFQLDFAIPVLELPGTRVDRVRAIAAGDTLTVPLLEDMQSVAEAMFDEKKSIIYTRAVIRSFLKAAAMKGAKKLAKDQGNAGLAWWVEKAGQMASSYVAQADTRGWQTMPGFAYATVTKLPPGTHEVTFEFLSNTGSILERRTRQVQVGGEHDLALAESIFLE